MSNEHIPNEQEVAKQKSETYQALSSFHETRAANTDPDNVPPLFDDYQDDIDAQKMADYWECNNGAISYNVPIDPAGGLKKGIVSKPYKSNVQIQMNINRSESGRLQKTGLRLVETIQFTNAIEEEITSMPFVRSIPLDGNMDVDAVDGTYSLDASIRSSDKTHLPLLPPSMLAGMDPNRVKFVVEHTISASETERCRCFLVYGDTDRDGSLENDDFSEEEDADEGKEEEEDNDEECSDSKSRNYRLLGIVLADEYKKVPVSPENRQPLTDLTKDESTSTPSPLDLLRVDAKGPNEMSEQDKMAALYEAIGKHNEKVMTTSGEDTGHDEETKEEQKLVRYSPTMFSLSSGVYLGDTFIREPMPTSGKEQPRGFGKLKSRRASDDNEEDNFANWSLGVQKTTLQFKWDYSSNVVQACTYGKCIGAMNNLKCSALSRSVGSIVIDEGRATKSREERRVVGYMDGAYLSGLIGTSYFRVSTAPFIDNFLDSLL